MLFRRSVLLDTSFVVALHNRQDAYYAKARDLERQLLAEKSLFVLHTGILLEIGDGFARLQRRRKGISILDGMRNDSKFVAAEVDEHLLDEAVSLYAARPDKEWGLTDCISFTLMNRLAIGEALTADVHFIQAGFRALLLEPDA